jgi:hypothetical protein
MSHDPKPQERQGDAARQPQPEGAVPHHGDDAGALRELSPGELEGVQGGWRFWPRRFGMAREVPWGLRW